MMKLLISSTISIKKYNFTFIFSITFEKKNHVEKEIFRNTNLVTS